MGNVEVRDGRDGGPCITLADDEISGDGYWLHAVSVYDIAKGNVEVWSASADAVGHAYIPRSACVPYGSPPPGFRSRPALPLEPGRMYDASIQAGVDGPMRRSTSHSTKFCVTPGVGGGLRTVRIDPDSRAWRDGVCPGR